jgi:hypothetical protein
VTSSPNKEALGPNLPGIQLRVVAAITRSRNPLVKLCYSTEPEMQWWSQKCSSSERDQQTHVGSLTLLLANLVSSANIQPPPSVRRCPPRRGPSAGLPYWPELGKRKRVSALGCAWPASRGMEGHPPAAPPTNLGDLKKQLLEYTG